MVLARLIEALSRPAAYPYPVERVEVCQTHISVVFLAGPCAYKIKKAVDLGFLDFTDLARRRHFCEEEVRLNRRLAAEVYHGVVPVTQERDQVSFDGAGAVVEWAVKMQRLPADATLLDWLHRGAIDGAIVEKLAHRVAAFHGQADAGDHIAAFGRHEIVAANARENFKQSAPQVDATVSTPVFHRLQLLTEAALNRLQPLIDRRALRGVPRDTHGDLHLEHVYFFPERQPPADLVIIDCIEFNERFRFSDPVADMAFLFMDLAFHGRRDLARAFADAYFHASGDQEGRALLAYYTAYRAIVRAKVEGLKAAETEVPPTEQARALAQARAHWLLALAELEERGRKPCVVLVGGLPGSGKSTLAQGLAAQAGFTVIRSDVVRKELVGTEPSGLTTGGGLYTREWTDRTYAECLRRVNLLLFDGGRALVDASFMAEGWRHAFLDAAAHWGVPAVFFVCRSDPEAVRQRLLTRRGDPSDADWSIHQLIAERWEDPGPETNKMTLDIWNSGTVQQAIQSALEHLHMLDLYADGESISSRSATVSAVKSP
ncbi:MAG: AAA family ATPase [Planctomycetes bacterium]|nr:AAA family ATPase [Planctomycetota bacterium]